MTTSLQPYFHEMPFDLPTKDGKSIFCILNRAGDQPADKVVVLSHGLGGGPYEHMHQQAKEYFSALGYDVVRFAYYWSEPGCRVLDETTLETHAEDLNTVIEHLRGTYRDIYACGHSYGGLTFLFAQPKITALGFWDSAYRPGWPKTALTLDDETTYVRFGGKKSLIGRAMVSEAQRLLSSPEELQERAGRIATPSLIVVAGAGDKQEDLQKMFNALSVPKDIVTVAGADHGFNASPALEELLKVTGNWFAQYPDTAAGGKGNEP